MSAFLRTRLSVLVSFLLVIASVGISQAQPTFSSTPVTTATVGTPYTYGISATDPSNAVLTFSAITKPAWLTLNTNGQSAAAQFGPSIASPGGVAGDPAGNVYATSYNGSATTIYKIAPDGTTTSWFTRQAGNVYSMLVNNGFLYIAYYAGHASGKGVVSRVSLSNPLSETIIYTAASNSTCLGMVYNNGSIYIALYTLGKVVKVDPTTLVASDVVATPTPFGIGFNSAGLLYIASFAGQSVSTYNLATSQLTAVLTSAGNCSDVKIDANDNVYVSGSGFVRKYVPNLSSFVSVYSPAGSVYSMSLTPGGSLVFGDVSAGRFARLQTGASLTGTPASGDIGNHNIVIRVSNGTTTTDQSFTIAVSGPPTIGALSNVTKNFGDAAFNITNPTSNSAGAFSYSSGNTGVATISGNTVTIVGAGSSIITATQAANGFYTTGTTTFTLTVNKIAPVFGAFADQSKLLSTGSYTITAPTSTSTGAITYTSSNTSVATVSGTAVTLAGVGTSTITANQAATTNYNAGTTTYVLTVATVPVITTGAVSGSISACTGTASASPGVQQFNVSGVNLTADIIVTAPTGFEVSTTLGSGYGSSVTLTQTSGTVNSTTIYIRSSSNATAGTISGNVSVTSGAATPGTAAVSGTINALPTPIIYASGATSFCPGGSVNLNVSALGNAMQLSGTQYAQSNNPALPVGNTSRTIEAWVKTSTSTNGVVANWGNTLTNQRSGLIVVNNHLYYVGENNDLQGSVNISTNSWHHVAITFDGTTLKLYVDGALDNSSTKSFNTTGTTLRIGQRSVGDAGSELFNGIIDELRIWNVARTQAELQANRFAEIPGNSTGLVAYYKMNETTGLSLTDASSNNVTSTLTAAANWIPSNAPGSFTTYAWTPGGATTSAITANASGNYTVTVTNAASCSTTSAPMSVTVNALPAATISAGSATTFCTGGSVVLTASAGSSYSWSNGATTQSITVNATGNYSVTVTNSNNCSATSAATSVTVNTLPTATISAGSATTFCSGGSVILTASAGSSYLWSNGATTQSTTVTTTGNYSVTVANANNCSATSATTAVTVNTLPTATISAGSATTFCTGGSVVLTASAGSSYSWSNGATTQSITVTGTGNYSVTVTNANNCSATSATTAVTVNTLPTATISAGSATTFCIGGSVVLTASAGSSYSWSTGANTQSITVNTAGNYSVTVTNANNCSATSAATTVTVNTLPVITAGSNSPVTAYGTLNLSASGANTYAWSGPNSFTSTGATPSVTNVSSGNAGAYIVTGTNTATGCANTATVNAVVNFIDATGLNFDGVNDYVSFSAPKVSNLNTFTIEAWVKPTLKSGTIYSEGLSSSLNPMFSLIHTPNGSNGFEIVLRNTSNIGLVAGTTNGNLIMNQWSHVAFVRTSATTAQLYINGALTDNFTFADPEFIQLDVANLGVRQRSNKEYYFTGSMDEVRIWSRALCQAEIQSNKDCELNAAGQTGLLSLYHFNQGLAGGDNTPVVATAPGVPSINNVAAGNGSALVGFTAPASDGGLPITAYTITSSPGGLTATGTSSPISINGLTNGTSYTFTIVATNAVGTSASSASSSSVIATGVPGAPSITAVYPGDGQALATFNAPASTGGLSITSYTITSSPGGFSATGTASPLTVIGLTNGTAYTFTVIANNAAGSSPASAPSNITTPLGAPSAPQNVSANIVGTSAVVSFEAPVTDGGLPVVNYKVTANPGGFTGIAASSPITIPGLTPGTTYSFTVTATNSAGTSIASAPVTASTVATVPNAPTILSAIAGNSQATVEFATPVNDGGSPVISYTIVSSPGSIAATGANSPLIVTSLTNGINYTFTAIANNANGSSVASAPSSAVTPVGLPGAPTAVSASLSGANVSVSFTTPVNNGGAVITSYVITSNPGSITATGAASPVIITGLTSGQQYAFTVVAINATGTSASSAPSAPIMVTGVPTAPSISSATAGNAQVTVSFAAPSSNGGSVITSYTVTSSPGNISATGAVSPIIVTGLTNGTAYTFTVKATNAIGNSAASSASASATPKTVPGAPTGLVASAVGSLSDRASVAFTAPASNGGSPITSYTVTSTPGSRTASGASSPLVVTGLTMGVSYTFRATATNILGTSSQSISSATFVPTGVPGQPRNVSASAASTTAATVQFLAPLSNGGLAITSYSVVSSPGNFQATGSNSPIIVNGLTPGGSYTFTVTAINSKGAGAVSASSNSVLTPGGTSSATTVFLVFNASLGGYIDARSGYLFNPEDGSETDPIDGTLKVNPYPPGQVPPTIQTSTDKTFVSYNSASGRYYTYRFSYVDPLEYLEIDRNGNPFASVESPIWLITDDFKMVDILDGVSNSSSGIKVDPLTGQPLTGLAEPITPLASPDSWLLPAAAPMASVNKKSIIRFLIESIIVICSKNSSSFYRER
jgi:hypothetical protein